MMKSLDDMEVGDLVRYENDGEIEDLVLPWPYHTITRYCVGAEGDS